MKTISLTLMLLIAWHSSSTAAPSADDAYKTTTDVKKIAWMDRGMEAVKTKLRDPKSAEFKGVFFSRAYKNIPVTCGRVNAKNGFGGYAGFQRFISAGKPDLTYLENDVADFQKLWAAMCPRG